MLAASAANAALVTFTTVVTNNTLQDKLYDFSNSLELTSALGNTGGSGSISIVVSDLRGGGAYVKSVGSSSIYSSFVRTNMVAQLATAVAFDGSPLVISAGHRSQASYAQSFTQPSFGLVGNVNDTIAMELKFVLSAGDQAAISGTFEVISSEPIPAPGAAALVCMACGIGLRGRRREHN
ncbi:MAG: hypothetical protein K8R92_06470 [Planctomycetes bacterium]|nr:hypothetical protein [Planctomycetota bacterium]